jgi:hypothetical protein
MRSRIILAILLAAIVNAAGCGGSSHKQVEPEVMLDSVQPIPTAHTEIDLGVRVNGVSQLSAPLHLKLEGGYVAGQRRRIPSFDLKLTASALGFPVDGELVSTGLNAYLSVYGDNYEIGSDAVTAANEAINQADESDDPLDLQPRDWFGRARVDGQGNEGGVDCERISAPLRAVAMTGNLDALARALDLSEPPLVKGRVRACVGFDHRFFNEFGMDADLLIPEADQPRLRGATSIHIDLDVVNSDVGEQQDISIPAGGGFRPIRDLALTLNDLGVSIPLG